MNIAGILSRQASERGDTPALIDVCAGRDRTLSFRALESASARFAGKMASHGVGKGDAVLILHPMSAELYAFLIAVFRIGAIGMFLDPSAGREYVDHCLQLIPPKAFFGSAKAQLLRLWTPSLRHVDLTFCSSPIPGSIHLSLRGHHLPRGNF